MFLGTIWWEQFIACMDACPSQWTKYSVYLNSEMDRNNIRKFPTLDLNLFAAFNLNSAINIFVANVQLSMNQQGGCCDNGRPYHDILREHLAHAGTGQWQQNFESVRVTCEKCLNSTMIRTFQYESLILVFFLFQKFATKSLSLSLLRKLWSIHYEVPMLLKYDRDFCWMALPTIFRVLLR